MDYVQSKNAEKVEKMCTAGLDPNFHGAHGETPLTLACGIHDNRAVILALVGGGAHIDFRNSEGQVILYYFLVDFFYEKLIFEINLLYFKAFTLKRF